MARLNKFVGLVVIFIGVWMMCLGTFTNPKTELFIKVLPLYAIVTFGAISLGKIGWQLVLLGINCSLKTIDECTDAHNELTKEISQAEKELAAKGYKF